jgi:hypothetical protein
VPRHNRPRIAIGALIVLGVSSVTATHPAPVGAAGTSGCPSTHTSYFDGWADISNRVGPNPYYFEGTSANIDVQAVALCTPDSEGRGNFSYSWDMIANGTGSGWAQSGFGTYQGISCLFHWAEQSASGSSYTDVYGSCVSPGQVHQYWNQYDPACTCLHSNVDTTRFMNSTFHPFSIWTQPFSPQFAGETKHSESDITGLVGSKTPFNHMLTQQYDETWPLAPCFLDSVNSVPTRYAQQGVNCYTDNIWTSNP